MLIRLLLILSILSGSLLAQDGKRISRHKFFDTTRVEDFQKVRRRRLTTDVDSTGIMMSAWGGQSFIKINLLSRMLINKTFYRESVINGQKSVTYGNRKFRFRMYVNKSGNFEFDAIFRSKPLSGRYTIPFDIQSQGLEFLYQPFMTKQDSLDGLFFMPDSAQDSWAIYRRGGGGDFINKQTGEASYYGSGKFGHIFRPKAWDNAGDTTWGFVRFNPSFTRMWIGVDSTWLANAVYPVTIDPTIGKTASGANQSALTNYQMRIQYPDSAVTGTGTWSIDSANARVKVLSNSGTNQVAVHLYTSAGGVCANSSFIASSTTTNVTNTTIANNKLTMSGTLSASTGYVVVFEGYNSGANNLRYAYDFGTYATEGKLNIANFTGPSTLSGCGKGTSQIITAWVSYSVSGGGGATTTSPRRRKVLIGSK